MRLTKDMKDRIINLVQEDVLKERGRAIVERREELFEKVRIPSFGDHYEAASKMPEEFFQRRSFIDALIPDVESINGYRDTIVQLGIRRDTSKNRNWRVGDHCYNGRPLPFGRLECSYRVIVRGDDELIAELKAHEADLKAFNEAFDEIERRLKSLLDSCSTDVKLLKTWPEGKPYVEKVAPAAEALLPAVPVAELNDFLATLKAA